ncbi:MAG: NAD(P)H-dependent oxidoreductase [Myxococcota bacterium]|nr:NAD(P)H-dependent oxidoreductase [Myxococcota bacterium]
MTQILAFAGSLRTNSMTRKALEVATAASRAAGGNVTLLDLAAPRLPLLDESATEPDPAVQAFRASVRACEALLIATPVYHDSYSGVLKNALDHLYDELADKVVALIVVGGGSNGQGQALEHLRSVFRETSSWVIPRQVIVANAAHAFGEDGRPVNLDVERRLVALGQELVLRGRQLSRRRVPSSARG